MRDRCFDFVWRHFQGQSPGNMGGQNCMGGLKEPRGKSNLRSAMEAIIASIAGGRVLRLCLNQSRE
jgi:hypothetical protein